MFKKNAYDADEVELMKAAFEAAWKFVATDAALEAVSAADRRISLGQALMAVFSSGERDVGQLANEAIDLVRRVHTSSRVQIARNSATTPVCTENLNPTVVVMKSAKQCT